MGVIFTPTLSWNRHLMEKNRTAKLAINCLWNKLLNNHKVPLSAKYTCYDSIIRAILCYAAQVWGCQEVDLLESFQRFFIKRLFKLPYNTPNYSLYLESGFGKLQFCTINLNINYISRVLSLTPDRLPRVLAQEVINKNVCWSRDWKQLASKCGLSVNFNPVCGEGERGNVVATQLISVANSLRANWYAECVGKARTSFYHRQNLFLDFELGDRHFLNDSLNINCVSWIMKCRGELINLNYKPWLKDRLYSCSLCNLTEDETVYHFMARCPILKNIRNRFLGKQFLNYDEYKHYLNGRDWQGLGRYLKYAWEYRWSLISEFNFG